MESIAIIEPTTYSIQTTIGIISSITCITGIGSLLGGFLTTAIPIVAADLQIPVGLQLWPASAFALSCGCTLILCGAIADVIGCRRMLLAGALLQSASALGAGLSITATQLIALRSIAGLASSMSLPSAVSIMARSFPENTMHRARSAAFSAMGGGQAIGFGLGLVLGGVFSDTVGWRWGFYTSAILNAGALILAWWVLPANIDGGPLYWNILSRRVVKEVDWIGALILSASLALMSYEFAIVAGSDTSWRIREPVNLALLCIAVGLIPAFVGWMRYQTRNGRQALIPNELWKSLPFTCVCVVVFLVWGTLNASEQLAALYLQEVRGISALTSSLYFLPSPICGAMMNVAVALLLPYLRPSYAVSAACLVSAAAPLLLATLCRVDGPEYWEGIFPAMAINPLGADLIYTIANLMVTAAFPSNTQALAGSVFNMLAQIGKSVGIATTAIVAQQVSASSIKQGSDARQAALEGYKAGWWYNFALSVVSVIFSLWGLQKVGKLGIKRE